MIEIEKELGMTSSEVALAERLDSVVEMMSRVLNAVPGSAYQQDKARQLTEKANGLHTLLSEEVDDADYPGGTRTKYDPLDPRPRADVVTTAVTVWAQSHEAGRLLYPVDTLPADLAARVTAERELNTALREATERGDSDEYNRLQQQYWETERDAGRATDADRPARKIITVLS